MARFNSPLSRIKIAAPCSADWDQMIGTNQVRFCGQCRLNVYNLSGMTRSDAESFIVRNEGRLCVRFYQRLDGSLLTKNCPVGLAAIRRRLSYVTTAVISTVFGFLTGLGVFRVTSNAVNRPVLMGVIAIEDHRLDRREEVPTMMGQLVEPAWRMGDVMVRPQPPSYRRKQPTDKVSREVKGKPLMKF
jgi:hypothetical protein